MRVASQPIRLDTQDAEHGMAEELDLRRRIEPDAEQGVGQPLGEQAVSLLAEPQRLLGLPALQARPGMRQLPADGGNEPGRLLLQDESCAPARISATADSSPTRPETRMNGTSSPLSRSSANASSAPKPGIA
jgi:hypothetical protein